MYWKIHVGTTAPGMLQVCLSYKYVSRCGDNAWQRFFSRLCGRVKHWHGYLLERLAACL